MHAAALRTLPGPDRGSPRRRRTVVAEADGHVSGVVTVAERPVHGGLLTCALYVAPTARRRGIGGALLRAALELRPDTRPMAGHARPDDAAVTRLAAQFGGRVLQYCPAPYVAPDSAEVRAWVDEHPAPTGCVVRPLSEVATPTAERALVSCYLWQHENWAPVTDLPGLRRYAADLVADADDECSMVCERAGEPTALAYLLPGWDDVPVVLAETVRRGEPDGRAQLAAALAALLSAAAQGNITELFLDGHDTDVHLRPIVDRLPTLRTDPFVLMEATRSGSPPAACS